MLGELYWPLHISVGKIRRRGLLRIFYFNDSLFWSNQVLVYLERTAPTFAGGEDASAVAR